MTLKLCVGLSKKVGQPNFGSLGASCQLEVDVELSDHPGKPLLLQRRISEAFCVCKAAIENELALERHLQVQTGMQPQVYGNRSSMNTLNGTNTVGGTDDRRHTTIAPGDQANGQPERTENAVPDAKPIRSATPAQARALQRIADQAGLDLIAHLRSEFGVEHVNQLTIRQASFLIDHLKTSRLAIQSR